MVGLVGYAPTTPSMSTRYSTIELQSHICSKILLYLKLIENSIGINYFAIMSFFKFFITIFSIYKNNFLSIF